MRYHGRHERRLHRWGRLVLRVALIAALAVIIAYPFVEARTIRVDRVTLESAELSAKVGQLRVVYLSDIHEGYFWNHSRTVNLVRKVNALNGDLVLLGGDYATDTKGAVDFFNNLPALHATYGVYAVFGEHDLTEPERRKELTTAMKNHGVTPLVNESRAVRIGTQDVYLAGLDDIERGTPDIRAVASELESSDFVILMAHNPAVIPDALKATDRHGRINWFDIGLYGHTHGGQLVVGGSLLGISGVERRYQRGWSVTNRIQMLVSDGVGTSVVPVRVGVPPQVHVITVKGTGREAQP